MIRTGKDYSIYFYSLSEVIPGLEQVQDYLSPEELNHLKNLNNEKAREQFLRGRFHLKSLLYQRLGILPSKIEFELHGEGKPVLKNNSQGLDFNISHSGDYLVIGFSSTKKIGVDLEQLREGPRVIAISERQFQPEEHQKLLAAKNPDERSLLFTKIWSAKEALIKARGGGVFKHSHDILLDVSHWGLLRLPEEFGDIQKWHLEIFQPFPNYVCSFALCEA